MSRAKGLYHSEVARRTPLSLTIKGNVERSKFRGQPDYIMVYDHEDGVERLFNLENPEIGETLEEWKGERVLITKAEGRDKDAYIEVEEDRGGRDDRSRREDRGRDDRRGRTDDRRRDDRRERTDDRRDDRRSDREDRPTERREERPRNEPAPAPRLTAEEIKERQLQTLRKCHVVKARMAINIVDAMLIVKEHLVPEMKGHGYTVDADLFWRMASTLAINGEKYTDINALPIEFPDLKPGKAKTKAASNPEPEPKPEPERRPEPPPRRDPEPPARRPLKHDEVPPIDVAEDDIPF